MKWKFQWKKIVVVIKMNWQFLGFEWWIFFLHFHSFLSILIIKWIMESIDEQNHFRIENGMFTFNFIAIKLRKKIIINNNHKPFCLVKIDKHTGRCIVRVCYCWIITTILQLKTEYHHHINCYRDTTIMIIFNITIYCFLANKIFCSSSSSNLQRGLMMMNVDSMQYP